VATLIGHNNTLSFAHAEPPLVGKIYDFESLRWTHTGSMLRLQGIPVYEILGPAIVILRGSHRPVWDAHPGADGVRIFVQLHNPQQLRPQEVFTLVLREGF
jgi:hypothetical protein